MHIVPTTRLGRLPRDQARVLCATTPSPTMASVQRKVPLTPLRAPLNTSDIERLAIFDTLTDNCDRFSSSPRRFAPRPLESLVRQRSLPRHNLFQDANTRRLVAIDNAKSFHCWSNDTAEETYVRLFWKDWKFETSDVLSAIRAVYAERSTLASKVLARNPRLASVRWALQSIDRRARLLLQISGAS